MALDAFIERMPKIELHVHLEGSIRPETLLQLAERHGIALPASTIEELREWYRFVDFDHFIRVYLALSECIRTADDIELIAREFLREQARQQVLHSEVTYTPYTHFLQKQLAFRDQLAALNRARAWGEESLGVTMGIVIDIPRNIDVEHGPMIADWAIEGYGDGVVAFGLGGPEAGHPPEKFADAFRRTREAGLPSVPHAGETAGAESVWGALRALHADRIGHGVRCLEDPVLVAELRERQIPLEVCPSSNVCLGVAPTLADHPLPALLEAGLYVTVNSDDPPMFDTTLTQELHAIAGVFDYGAGDLETLMMNALNAAFITPERRAALEPMMRMDIAELRGACEV